MLMSQTRIPRAITLIALTCCVVCWASYYSAHMGQGAPLRPLPGKDAKAPANKMFPDGLEHDFGTVIRGTECKHTFRIVNTTDGPLQITNLNYG
jgi:hypothetical protein